MPQSSGFCSVYCCCFEPQSPCVAQAGLELMTPCLCWARMASIYTRAISPALCLELPTPCSGLMPLEYWVNRPASPATPRRPGSTWAPASSHSDWVLWTSKEVIQTPLSISPPPSAGPDVLGSVCNLLSESPLHIIAFIRFWIHAVQCLPDISWLSLKPRTPYSP